MKHTNLTAVDYIIDSLGEYTDLSTEFDTDNVVQTYLGDGLVLFAVMPSNTAIIYAEGQEISVSIHQAKKLMEAFKIRKEEL